MGRISDKIMGSVDQFAARFGNRLSNWMIDWAARGVVRFIETIEPEGLDFIDESLSKLSDAPGTPDTIKALIGKIRAGGKPIPLLLAIPIAVIFIVPMITAFFQPLGRIITYGQERFFKSGRMDATTVIHAWWRGHMTEARMRSTLVDHGLDETDIETLINVTKFYPAPADLINWQAKEVFEPAMREKYGLLAEIGELERDAFYKAGMTDEQIDNYWMAHWEHPELRTIIEMLRRTDFTEDDMREWFRLVEIPPFWRDKLIEISYEVPTRVDVRRWWDMRTISEARLREIYVHQGYHGEDLEDYIRWTKVYTDFPMMITRWKNGWITEQDVRDWLAGLEIPAERIDQFIQEKLKADQPERTAKERDITKTDIIKGVKKGVISRAEGAELLVDMGYDEDEAVYILEINIPRDEEDVVIRQRELTKADILKGLKTEVITRAQAGTRLAELRYSPTDAEFLLKIFDAQVKPPAEPREREASKADIILAVKKGLITPEEAYLMLQDLDFTPEASIFILEVKAEVSPFSPVNFAEFKDRAQKYRVVIGMEAKPMPEEVKTAAAEVVKLTGEVAALELSIKEAQRGLIDQEVLPEAATKRLKTLQVKRNRAESKLSAAKSEYDRLVAEWKHEIT